MELFCATAHGYLPYSQQLPHSFYRHGGGTPCMGKYLNVYFNLGHNSLGVAVRPFAVCTAASPMVLFEPIPGQEERNAGLFLEAGAAIRCNNLPVAAWKVATSLDDPARLKQKRDAVGRMARPKAPADIAQDALGLVNWSVLSKRAN